MFKVRSLVLDFFILVLGFTLKLAPDTCHKCLEITWVLTEERLKLFLGYGNILALVKSMIMLVLGPLKANASAKKKGSKQGTVGPSGPNNIKIVFALLAKVITVYMWLFMIQVRKPSLELAFIGVFLMTYQLQKIILYLEKQFHAKLDTSLKIRLGIFNFR